MAAQPGSNPRATAFAIGLGTLLCLVAVWAYWTTLGVVAWRWAEDPQYSHGYLVPLFSLYLLWLRRAGIFAQPRVNAMGLVAILAAVAIRLVGAHFHYEYLDQVSLLPCLSGIFLLAGGWGAFVWSLPAVAFLAFMVPLPYSVSLAMSGPMQTFATNVSTFFLQVLGLPAIAEGNVILLNEIELGIVEACSGLRMLVVFFALSTAVSMLIHKPLWEKLLIASSTIPIALASNVLRITVTGVFYDTFGNRYGGTFFHDLAGWLMMPLGLAFLGMELWILRTLLVAPANETASPSQLGLPGGEINPVTLYREGRSARRQKAAAVAAAPVSLSHANGEPVVEACAATSSQ